MTIAPPPRRPLGTMVAYGFANRALTVDLAIADRLGATVLEIFPDWRVGPDPVVLGKQVRDHGLQVWSAHGCWGGQTIQADRVDLGHPEARVFRASVDDLKRCIDWLSAAGGTCLVVHPGGLSASEETAARRATLGSGLRALAEHARGTGVVICVENMPPGVHPGSRMADLSALVAEWDLPELALALDTGHAHIAADAASETLAAGGRLRTTHVHDNNGRQDAHLPPGLGTIDWPAWGRALDQIDYAGPVMLECIRHLRTNPETLNAGLDDLLARLTARPCGS